MRLSFSHARSARTIILAVSLAAIPNAALPQGLPIPAGLRDLPAPSPTPTADEAEISPRASLQEFSDLCRARRYAEAVRFMELPPGVSEKDAMRLAPKLKAVLDFNLVDLAHVSASPTGRLDDGLPPDREEVGFVFTVSEENREPIRMVRHQVGESGYWMFARKSVASVSRWYDSLPDRKLRDQLPPLFFVPGPRGVLLWQWLALLLVLPLAGLLGRFFGWPTRKLLAHLAARTPTHWDDTLVPKLRGPIALGWSILLFVFACLSLRLNLAGLHLVLQLTLAAAAVWLFWILLKLLRFWADVAGASDWGKTNPAAPSILGLGLRMGQVVLILLGLLVSLSAFGLNIGSVLAGLGIGGIAIALAAQKTVENLFGSLSIAVDQPLHVGDFVKVGDLQGDVEAIGLRSTRIRTSDRTVITIPNGKLADREIETFGPRDRIRLYLVLGLQYSTKPQVVRDVMAGLEAVLREHPRLWPGDRIVKLRGFGDFALEIEVIAWFQTRDAAEFRVIREDVLLKFLEVVERCGGVIALPAPAVRLVHDTGPGPGGTQ